MNAEANTKSRLWRRYSRLSIRGLIILVLVIGVWLGWLARNARVQSDAVTTIENARGHVAYEWDLTDGHITVRGKPWAPRQLVDLIGLDYFGSVTTVTLTYSSAATDVTMAQIGRLFQLRVLNLRSTPVNDAGLAYLKSLSDLSYLDLQSTQVTNAGLVHLKGLTNLQFLSLRDTEVSDSGLVQLGRLTDLKVLIVGTHVTNAGVNGLKQAMPSLTVSR
jgi:hypothetical protein